MIGKTLDHRRLVEKPDCQELISPDGKTARPIGGKLIYGIQRIDDRIEFFSIEVATGAEKIPGDLGKDFMPSSSLMPGIRFSLSPDGKSFVYGIAKSKSNLWVLEGFEPKTGLLARLTGKIFK